MDRSVPPPINEPRERVTVEQLSQEYIDRLRRGEEVSLDEYCERYPLLAAQIKQLFPMIAGMENLRRKQDQARRSAPSLLTTPRLERLGDFRIVREIGRGGMGIVYEAEQESLGRSVALKVLPRQLMLDDNSRRRFEREARLAASLHHTNIVQVFGVGTDQDVDYYVMQLIDGVGLDRIVLGAKTNSAGVRDDRSPHLVVTQPLTEHTPLSLAPVEPVSFFPISTERVDRPVELWTADIHDPLSVGSVTRIGIQVADALAHAHEHGVLHRDIKPGNLLLDDHGNVWVTDFGLAKPLEQQDSVHSRQIVGTVRYMAPEVFRGEVDYRCDIYSLGITLYELLTRTAAFSAPNHEGLIQQITRGALRPLRQLNGAVSADLEVVIMKAAACDPRDRYTTAQLLADDLRAVLEDHPIRARRLSVVERARRWGRKNRAVAALSAVTLLLLMLVALVSSVGYFRVNEALRGVTEARQQSEAAASLASDALKKIFDRFASGGIGVVDEDEQQVLDSVTPPALSPEAALLLQELQTYYDALADLRQGDNQFARSAIDARRRVGDIYRQLGRYDNAIDAYQQVMQQYNRLAPYNSVLAQDRVFVARVYNGVGSALLMMNRSAESATEHDRALRALREATQPWSADVRFEMARSHYLKAQWIRPGKGPLAMPPLLSDEQTHPSPTGEPGPPQEGKGPKSRPPRGDEPDLFGPPQRRGPRKSPQFFEDRQAQIENVHAALALLEPLVVEQPQATRYRLLLAACLRELVPDDPQHRSEADVAARARAIEILEQLIAERPDVPAYRYELCETLSKIDILSGDLTAESLRSAEEQLQRTLREAEQLVEVYPNMPDFVASLAHSHFKLAAVYEGWSRNMDPAVRREWLEKAELHVREAITQQTLLAKRFPDAPAFNAWLALFQVRMALVLRAQGVRLEQARGFVEQALVRLQTLIDQHPEQEQPKSLKGQAYAVLASLHAAEGETRQAREAWEQAERLLPPRPEFQGGGKNFGPGQGPGPGGPGRERFGGPPFGPGGPREPFDGKAGPGRPPKAAPPPKGKD